MTGPRNPGFLRLGEPDTRYQDCLGIVVPVPYERTVSWGRGTSGGPNAILAASAYVESWDEILCEEPWREGGIHTVSPVEDEGDDLTAFLDRLADVADRLFVDGKFPIFLGGEHGLTIGPVRAARKSFERLSVLQLDAHADLRDSYRGTPWSHACVMRRILDLGVPSVPVGIRSVSPEEAAFIDERDLPIVWSHQIARGDEWMEAAISALTDTVYVTFDVDFFDPSVIPTTGTPEPGGGSWHQTMRFLARVFEEKRVIGMDVVELAPVEGLHAADFTVAKLVYRCFGYRFHKWGETSDREGGPGSSA